MESAEAPPASVDVRPILLVDDDVDLCRLMDKFFSQHQFHVDSVHDGFKGISRAIEGRYDLIILDVMMPGLSGIEVLRQIRKRSAIPVILLTARTEQEDRIAGLDAGADDYLSKPFGPHELLARVRAVLRRSGVAMSLPRATIRIGELQLHLENREVWTENQKIELTSSEFDVLEALARSPGRIVSRDEIGAVLYRREVAPEERTIDVYVSRLRKKFEKHKRIAIRSVRGVGYVLSATHS